MITTTEKAAIRIKNILDAKNTYNEENSLPKILGYRFAVKAGGCSGFQYDFYPIYFFDKYDEIFESHGIKIYVDKKSLAIVDGTEIDCSDNLLDKHQFLFKNPHATSLCGCGVSFDLK